LYNYVYFLPLLLFRFFVSFYSSPLYTVWHSCVKREIHRETISLSFKVIFTLKSVD
jgi:hypothetical protein